MSKVVINAKSEKAAVSRTDSSGTISRTDSSGTTVIVESGKDTAVYENSEGTVSDQNTETEDTSAAAENIAAEGEGVTEETAETGDAAVTDEAAGDIAAEDGMIGIPEGEIIVDDGMYTDPGFNGGMFPDPSMETGMAEVKNPLMSSWPFVIGISAAVLFVSIALGALLARRKIKKGIDLYED